MEGIYIKKLKNCKSEQVISLYKEAGWWNEEDKKNKLKIKKIIKGSFLFVGAFYKKDLIGMARVISDGLSDAYIQDVIVKKDYRNKSIGKKLIRFILGFLEKKRISWIGLISVPESSGFYSNLGFKKLENYIPMIYKGNK